MWSKKRRARNLVSSRKNGEPEKNVNIKISKGLKIISISFRTVDYKTSRSTQTHLNPPSFKIYWLALQLLNKPLNQHKPNKDLVQPTTQPTVIPGTCLISLQEIRNFSSLTLNYDERLMDGHYL